MSQETDAHLKFFNEAILAPALADQEHVDDDFTSLTRRSIVADFGAIEAAHWARLGVKIGYFDLKDALNLISSSKGIFKAWSTLRNKNIISGTDEWSKIIHSNKNETATLNEEVFSLADDVNPRKLESLQGTFQIFLLLAAENILDDTTREFLDHIGWAGDAWNDRTRAQIYYPARSVQEIGLGFSNVLRYWEETYSSSLEILKEDWLSFLNSDESDCFMGLKLTSTRTDWTFLHDVRAILIPRFNLGDVDVVKRYVVLAGEFAGFARDDSATWLDGRRGTFETLMSLISYAGGGAVVAEQRVGLWALFVKSSETRSALGEQSF